MIDRQNFVSKLFLFRRESLYFPTIFLNFEVDVISHLPEKKKKKKKKTPLNAAYIF